MKAERGDGRMQSHKRGESEKQEWERGMRCI